MNECIEQKKKSVSMNQSQLGILDSIFPGNRPIRSLPEKVVCIGRDNELSKTSAVQTSTRVLIGWPRHGTE